MSQRHQMNGAYHAVEDRVAGHTIAHILRARAVAEEGKTAYTFLADGEAQALDMTYGELDRRARSVAERLETIGVARGEHVLLLYPQGMDYVAAFFGCLYAGAVAVPAYPPRRNSSLARIRAMLLDCGARVALTTAKVRSLVDGRVEQEAWLKGVSWHATDDLDKAADRWTPRSPFPDANSLAFLQYTSGSTSKPKGVMVSHDNLLVTLEDLDRGWDHTPDSVVVSWLPMFHDMGLIYGVLQPLYCGIPGVLMPPAAFLQSPVRWLRAISHFKGTHSGAPNFAYELCLNKISKEQRVGLDLTSWRMALNAAEPVRASTLRRFSEVFSPAGFSRTAFSPGYGLAECTLKTTAVRAWEAATVVRVNSELLERGIVGLAGPSEEGRELVGCGVSEVGNRIEIVEAESGVPCTANRVGEIWVSGPCVAQGYWNRPEETAATFGARVAGGSEDLFLKTGDIGFLHGGELFITGRLKDLIILRGANHYPQDIELTVQHSHPSLAADCGAAFSIEADGEERLVVVQELDRSARRKLDSERVIAEVRQAVAQEHDLQVHEIVLIKPATLPKTSSGKIMRSACRAKYLGGELDAISRWKHGDGKACEPQEAKEMVAIGKTVEEEPERAIARWLVQELSRRLHIGAAEIDIEEPFARYGLDSMGVVALSAELENWLGRRVDPTVAYDYPSIAMLSKHLAGRAEWRSPAPVHSAGHEAIAVIGIGCRFPKAENPEAFWSLLHNGVDAISETPPSRWNGDGPRWGGFLDQIDRFDPQFFSISPREAEQLDPQQRLLLEVCWEAIEHSGKAIERVMGTRAGVFIGISSNEYSRIAHDAGLDPYSATGTAGSIAANRISYQFDFHGPSWAVDTACSSSLVAVHQAVQSLRRNDCELALAGGVSLVLTPNWTIAFQKAGMLSPDGRCKTFDSRADGYVRGEGCGVIALKRLSDAVRDGDTIHAVIRGSSVNQDGRSNGLTAPNGPSQREVIREALRDAAVEPGEVTYIEAHGTGTSLGDPIELNSLKEVLMEGRGPNERCWIGSVKTNCGHLEAAAGICGLIKVILALGHEEIPPHLHLNRLNPLISLDGTPLAIPTTVQDWRRGARPRVAGVSSFGFGGTNAHVVVEEPPAAKEVEGADRQTRTERPQHLFALSARSERALQDLARRYADRLGGPLREVPVADACFSTNTGRSHFKNRLTVVTDSTPALAEQLRVLADAPGNFSTAQEHPRAAVLFTGQGSQYAGMGRQLYETQPTFRAALEACDEILRPLLSQSLTGALYSGEKGVAERFLEDAACVQTALFSLEYSVYWLWQSWGLRVDAVMGHSLGEYVAACVAGCFSLEDGLTLVAERGRLMQEIVTGRNGPASSGGEMMAVFAEPMRLAGIVTAAHGELAIAALNGPANVVLSGASTAISNAMAACESQGIVFERLRVGQAFHSPQIEPMLDAFEQAARRVSYKPPSVSLVSNLTGKMFAEGDIPDAKYWRRHARETVRFQDGIEALLEDGISAFVEVGPRATLVSLGKRCSGGARATWLASLAHGKSDWDVLLESVAGAYRLGVEIDWGGFDRDYARSRVSLPTYAFQRKRYWIGNAQEVEGKAMNAPSKDRTKAIEESLSTMVANLLHAEVKDIDVRTRFLDMGADSIVFVDAVRRIQQTHGVKIPIRSFFEDLTNIEALAAYIDAQSGRNDATGGKEPVPAEPISPQPAIRSAAGIAAAPIAAAGSAVEQIVMRQLDLMNSQLALLRGHAVPEPPAAERAGMPDAQAVAIASEKASIASHPQQAKDLEDDDRRTLSGEQQRWLDDFSLRYSARTRRSKQAAQRSRPVLADLRSVMALRPELKEMSYPIVAERSLGSRFWDLDGNEYVDIAMGFGVNLFGHRAPFLEQAIEEQLQRGIQVGPQSDMAHEVAELISELTGMERVTFCNSGTEAVMAALRMVRAASGHSRIVMFTGSYHGHYDGTMAVARRQGSEWRAAPMAPGVPQYVADDILVLPYGEANSLEHIKAHLGELAAVLVEPVQSRSPGLQPAEFLKQLRDITRSAGVALIFDEVITGFRVHPRGCQGHFQIEPDVATYGKVIGGGMPIGVVAGKARYLDRIDGGAWNYGDDSKPQVSRTFVAGTFCKHPLAMACARATLRHLKKEGPQLQERLNARTAELASSANALFQDAGLPIAAHHFGSLFRFALASNTSYVYQPLEMDLFHHHLIHEGVYVWEGRTCFLSTAHSDGDLSRILAAVKKGVHALQRGGFWKAARKETGVGLVKAEASRVFPLTAAQKQLWALAKMDEAGSLAYTLCVSLELRGRLRVEALDRAIQKVVSRHEALRTRFTDEGDVQEVELEVAVRCSLADYSSKAHEERERARGEWLESQSKIPFRLDRAPLFRANLLKLDENLHILSIAAHHIVADGWSMGVVLKEICEFYASVCGSGEEPEAPQLQFGAMVRWQEEQRTTPQMEAQGRYWRSRLEDAQAVLDIPADHARPRDNSFRGNRETMRLNSDLAQTLRELSRKRGVTLFITLLSAYSILLHRLSSQDEVIVGVPAAGRSLEGSERAVGYFAHVLPVRSCLRGSESYEYYLGVLKAEVLADYENQDFPFAWLIEEAETKEKRSRIVTVLFNLDRPVALDGMPGIEAGWISQPIGNTAFDLNLNVTEVDGAFVLDLDGNADLWEPASIRRMLSQLHSILQNICEDGRQPVREIPLLTPAEQKLVLTDWNNTEADYPRDRCIHQLFEDQVRRQPDAIAIVSAEGQLSYRALNAAANGLARRLRKLGAGPEVRVGICVGRKPELIVGLLAILKAGAAYVPLDPSYPHDRLSYIVEHAEVGILVTERALDVALPARSIVYVDDEAASGDAVEGNAHSGVMAQNPAYVIYTSGSTGKPKGVILEHRSVVNFLAAMPGLTGVTDRSSMLAVTSVSFDTHVVEIYVPLAFGGRIVLAREAEARDGKELGRVVRRNQVTIMQATPATYRLLAEEDPGSLRDVQVISGGDALPGQLGRALMAASNGLQNFYGPTETTVYSSAHDLRGIGAGESGHDGYVPLGRPMANTRLYVFDKEAIKTLSMCPVAVGTPGELYIGGDGLARGYLKKADLTAQRFVPDPFHPRPGSRVYSSGDLVCHRPDGVVDFLGRLDFQVKIRGYRIEIGEIESVLSTHPAIRHCVVAAQKREAGLYRLVGYVVPVASAPTVSELRSYLSQKLPSYMIPEAFVVLDALPMTPNRKVDRTALPAPPEDAAENEQEPAAPRNDTEARVAWIYCDVLGRKRVGIHDGFFDLGGQSLLAIKVRSRVLDAFGIDLPARRVFDLPTVALLSEFIDSVRKQGNADCQLPPIVLVTQCGARPLSFAQQRLFFLEQHGDSRSMFNMAGALCFRGPLDAEVLRASLARIIERHEVLRTTYKITEAGPQQCVETGQDLLLETVDLNRESVEEQSRELRRMATAEGLAPFSLEDGPLIRFKLVRCNGEVARALGEEGEILDGGADRDGEFHVLLLTVHHIAFDGWSIELFFRELSELYRASLEKVDPALPQIVVQYSDFACWQRCWLLPGNSVYEAHLEYWRERLRGLPVLELPTDRTRGEKPSLRGARHSVTVSPATVSELRALCTSASCTLFAGLLATFNVLLHRLSGQSDIVIGTDVANRTRKDVENLIGFFVNQLVLRTDLSGVRTFRDVLARSREVVFGAEAHQDLPFDRLVEALRPERRANRAPLFQVKLVHGDARPPLFEIRGLQTSLLEIDTGATQLDLILFLMETPKGLRMTFEYSVDLFDPSTIARMADQYSRLIASLTSAPDAALNTVEARTSMESTTQAVARRQRPAIDLEKLKNSPVPARGHSSAGEFRVESPLSNGALPGVLVPANGHRDLASTAESHKGFVESQLMEHGAVLFRGFDAGSVPAFDRFTKGICGELFMENGEHPRENISGTVYTPVFFSPERKLLWHNENTFNYRWPQKIWFCCVQPAEQGGETPIVDSRKVYERMDPSVRERFMKHGISYVRNYGDGPGLSWQKVFRTEDRAQVERYCRENRIEYEWKGGDRLRTRSTRPAAVRHSGTGEYCWINQAQHWHLSCLDDRTREALLAIFAEEDLPRTCCFGDGSPIPDADMQSICQLYRELEVSFPWQRGDVLMVDNVLTAHARNPFSGERKLLVAMGELRSYADFSN